MATGDIPVDEVKDTSNPASQTAISAQTTAAGNNQFVPGAEAPEGSSPTQPLGPQPAIPQSQIGADAAALNASPAPKPVDQALVSGSPRQQQLLSEAEDTVARQNYEDSRSAKPAPEVGAKITDSYVPQGVAVATNKQGVIQNVVETGITKKQQPPTAPQSQADKITDDIAANEAQQTEQANAHKKIEAAQPAPGAAGATPTEEAASTPNQPAQSDAIGVGIQTIQKQIADLHTKIDATKLPGNVNGPVAQISQPEAINPESMSAAAAIGKGKLDKGPKAFAQEGMAATAKAQRAPGESADAARLRAYNEGVMAAMIAAFDSVVANEMRASKTGQPQTSVEAETLKAKMLGWAGNSADMLASHIDSEVNRMISPAAREDIKRQNANADAIAKANFQLETEKAQKQIAEWSKEIVKLEEQATSLQLTDAYAKASGKKIEAEEEAKEPARKRASEEKQREFDQKEQDRKEQERDRKEKTQAETERREIARIDKAIDKAHSGYEKAIADYDKADARIDTKRRELVALTKDPPRKSSEHYADYQAAVKELKDEIQDQKDARIAAKTNQKKYEDSLANAEKEKESYDRPKQTAEEKGSERNEELDNEFAEERERERGMTPAQKRAKFLADQAVAKEHGA